MSLKLKLISLISAFMLVLGMLLFGVFAATNVTIQMGGSLSFIATDVYARVTGAITGAGVGNQTLPPIEFSASNENPDQSGWQNLDLEFNTAGDPITIKVTVENLASDRNLTVNLQDNFSSQQGVLVKEVRNGSSTYTGTDVVLNASTGAETSTTTFAITLSLSSKNNSLPDTEFGYTINLYDASYVPPGEEITGFSFSTNDDGTATLTSYMGTDTNVVIPESFSILTIDTGVAGYTETFNNMDEFTAYTNNQYNQAILMVGFYYMTTPLTERTFVTNFESYFAELDTLAGGDMTKIFPMTIETVNYEMTYENFTSLGEVGQRGIIKPLYDVMFGNVGGATIEFNSGEKYDISSANAEDIGNEIMSSSLSENSFPIKMSYSSLKTMYVEGDDYTLTSIGASAFRDCSGLTSVDLSGCTSLTTIGTAAFYGCSGLTSIAIPEGVTTIGTYAFDNCSGLTSITLPSSLTTIGPSAFFSCSGLKTMNYLGTLESWCAIDFGDYFSNPTYYTHALYIQGKEITEVVVPEGIKALAYTFYNCENITSVSLPSSLTSIGYYAFRNCDGLTSVDLSGCTSLTTISSSAFSDCSGLTSITIPESVTTIRAYAFYDCRSLTSITIYATTPPTLGSDAIPIDVTNIYVPEASVGTYQSASGWSSFASKISAIVE